jgi:hypothetical protein
VTAPPVIPLLKPVAEPTGWVSMRPDVAGEFVRFADVEEALQDRYRLDWLLPLISGGTGVTDVECTRRMTSLALGVSGGLKGRALVDFARTRCST